MDELPRTFAVGDEALESLWRELAADPHHRAHLWVSDNGDVCLDFTSRLALYCLGLKFLEYALREDRVAIEFFPLCPVKPDGTHDELVVDGLRLSAESTRLFVSYPLGIDEVRDLLPQQ